MLPETSHWVDPGHLTWREHGRLSGGIARLNDRHLGRALSVVQADPQVPLMASLINSIALKIDRCSRCSRRQQRQSDE